MRFNWQATNRRERNAAYNRRYSLAYWLFAQHLIRAGRTMINYPLL